MWALALVRVCYLQVHPAIYIDANKRRIKEEFVAMKEGVLLINHFWSRKLAAQGAEKMIKFLVLVNKQVHL